MQRSVAKLFALTLLLLTQHLLGADSLSVWKRNNMKVAFDVDQRFTRINKQNNINIWGFRTGVFIKDAYKTGLGMYWSNFAFKQTIDLQGFSGLTQQQQVRFGTIYYEPFLIRKEIWELSAMGEIGFGNSFYSYFTSNGSLVFSSAPQRIFPLGVGLSFSVKCPPIGGFVPTRWLALNFIGGYRHNLNNLVDFRGAFDGAFYSVGVTFLMDRFQDDFKSWKQKRKHEAAFN